jgi:hypothetical protein
LTLLAHITAENLAKYNQTANRLAYIKHLREGFRRTPRTEADTAHITAKTEMLQLTLAQKRGELVHQSDVDVLLDDILGITLTALSSMPARCAPRGELGVRHCIENVVREVRREIAARCQQKADERGEPPLAEQLRGLAPPHFT